MKEEAGGRGERNHGFKSFQRTYLKKTNKLILSFDKKKKSYRAFVHDPNQFLDDLHLSFLIYKKRIYNSWLYVT